jgi:hypothetical protein
MKPKQLSGADGLVIRRVRNISFGEDCSQEA